MLAFLTRRQDTPTSDTQISAPPWPEGVFARYLTLAKATVDLSHETSSNEQSYTVSTCTGCAARESHGWENWYRGSGGHIVKYQDRSKGDGEAREWAQGHAEKCRALPKPTA